MNVLSPKFGLSLVAGAALVIGGVSMLPTAPAVAGQGCANCEKGADAYGDKADGKKAKGDIIDVATGPNMEKVSTLVAAIKAAGLVEALKGDGPFTVFAPTNEAFEALPEGTVDSLLKPENKEKLQQILLYHVHAGDAIKAKDVKTMSLSTLNGEPLMVKVADGKVMVNDAQVIKTDVMATNGVIHWVDKVILPGM